MGRSYRISKIIDKRKKQGRVEYRIRWTGFKSSQDTWEPATEIMPVAYRLVRDFHNRSKNSNNSASNASSPSSSKEQQPIDQGSPKKQQTQPRLPKLMALKQLQQSQPEPPQAQKLPQKQQTAAKLMRKKGGKQQPQRARVLALPKRKAKKRLQKLQPKQQKQQAKKNNQQKSADDASTVSASNPSSAASASSSSSSASSAASSAASSTVSPNSQPSQPPQPLPPSQQSQSPPLPIPSQMQQQQQSELAALPSASIDWNLKYGLEGGSAPVTPRHLSPSSPSTAPVALIASAVDSPSALLAPASSPPLAPSPRPEQQQQQQQQSQPSLPQTPTSSSSDLRRYHAGVIDAIDSIRRLKRKVLLDRVVQAVCKKLRVGAGLAEAVIEDMVRIGRLKKVRCSTDNSLTLYLPNQKPRSVAVSTVSAKAKPKSQQQQQQLQAKKTTHIRNNYHELFVKQPAHSPGVFEIWLVGPRNGTGQPGCCFTVRLMQELCRALQQALDNPACRLVRLANTDPRCFSRGVDLSSMLAAKPGQEASLAVNQLTDELQRLVSAMVEFPKLLVATVTGACVGLGAALLPLCDFVYASDSAYFYLPYAKLKQPCEAGVSYTLRQALGKPTASEMLLAGRKLTANEACTRGLVSSVIFADTFQQEAAVRCASIGASVGAENVRQTKALMHSTSRSSVIQACQAECLALRSYWLRDDARQLMREFLGEDRDLLERAEASVL